jgi:hypothetical protein
MMAMRGAMSYVAPWVIVTSLAVALSWLGVRDVVRSAISDRSLPEPLSGPVIHASPTVPDSAAPPGAQGGPGDDESASGTLSPSPSSPSSPSPSKRHEDDGQGAVRSFSARGGRAVLAFPGPRGVRLMSATPNPGYETRVSSNQGWLRVDFTDDDRSSSVIASWHDHDTIVKVYEYGGSP